MIDLDLIYPINLEKTEALKRRLGPNNPKMLEIEEKIRILKSGYNGEVTLSYYLGLLPPENYHIFHGLRLPIGKTYFQIDALLLSPKIIIPLETKNYSGTLLIEKHQLIQEANLQKNIYQNPITQSNRQTILLKYLFEKNKIPVMPMENRVVFSRTSAEIKISQGYTEADRKIFKAGELLTKIKEIEKYYKQETIDQAAIKRIKTLLLKRHSPLSSNILEMFKIHQSEIPTGVQCPICLFLPMVYHRKIWICPNCQFISKDAFLQAIRDYFLLIKPTITNSELCSFLHLPSPRAATYLLSLLNLPYIGENRGRVYFLK